MLDVRALLNSSVLGNVSLGVVRVKGDAVLVTLRARNSGDVVQLENRLRATTISYRFDTSPVWSGAGYYDMTLLVWPAGTKVVSSPRPSVRWVEMEVKKLSPPLVDVEKVVDVGDGYVVTLTLLGGVTVESVTTRLQAISEKLTDFAVISDSMSIDRPSVRVAQLKLRVR